MSAIIINKNNFQNEIMDSEKTVLLDFWAPWCAPCRMVVPIIEEIASEPSKIGYIGRWWLYWSGTGRKFERAWHGCYNRPAA